MAVLGRGIAVVEQVDGKWIQAVLWNKRALIKDRHKCVVATFFAHVPWREVILLTVRPHISLTKQYFTGLIAVLGTTISPYLFFWQASQEVEEVKNNRGEKPLKTRSQAGGRTSWVVFKWTRMWAWLFLILWQNWDETSD